MTERPEGPVGEHVLVYRRLRRAFGGTADERRRKENAGDTTSVPFGGGRDPRGLGDVLERFTAERGWESPLARADLLGEWPALIGEETAAHAMPIGIEEGVLLVRCDSTAWAQQLRVMRERILTRILELHPSAGVESVRFLGPDTPSWKRGPRAIPGRGPRDTYG